MSVFNLLKKYPELLDLEYLSNAERIRSLIAIFNRDIADNNDFSFRGSRIWPIKSNGTIPMELLFDHLTTVKEQDSENKEKRFFDIDRSKRLHWIRPHTEEEIKDEIVYFSYEDRINGKSVIRTYLYNKLQKYVIVLEPQRQPSNYYLLTAYYLNRPEGEKIILKKLKRKLDVVV